MTATAVNRGGPFDGQPTRPRREGHPLLSLEEMILDETSVFIMTVFRREVFERSAASTSRSGPARITTSGCVPRRPASCSASMLNRVPGIASAARACRGSARGCSKDLVTSYRKAAARARTGSREFDAIIAQANRFESELLLERAKVALEGHDFANAADLLDALRARGGSWLVGLTAFLARHVPALASLAYRTRGWRPRVRVSPREHSQTRPAKVGPTLART